MPCLLVSGYAGNNGGKIGHTNAAMTQNDHRFTEANIPTLLIAGLADHAHEKGLNTERWFAGQGLTIAHIRQSETMISFRQAAVIIRRALRALPSEPLGLHVGSRDALASFGMLGFAMLSSQNVREAFATGLKYHLASGSLMDVEAETTTTEVALRLHERFPDPELSITDLWLSLPAAVQLPGSVQLQGKSLGAACGANGAFTCYAQRGKPRHCARRLPETNRAL